MLSFASLCLQRWSDLSVLFSMHPENKAGQQKNPQPSQWRKTCLYLPYGCCEGLKAACHDVAISHVFYLFLLLLIIFHCQNIGGYAYAD